METIKRSLHWCLVMMIPGFLGPARASEATPTPVLRHGLGFVTGYISGTGLAYKYLPLPDLAVHVNGLAIGSTNTEVSYTVGLGVQKVLARYGPAARLTVNAGVYWSQTKDYDPSDDIDSLWGYPPEYWVRKKDRRIISGGLGFGLEYRLGPLGLGFSGGMRVVKEWGYPGADEDYFDRYYDVQAGDIRYPTLSQAQDADMSSFYRFGPVGDVTVFYYFGKP